MSKKILLIDDDSTAHLVTVPILTKAGYIAISAKSGEQGLLVALKEKPDLILMDVLMPGIKGRELCAKMKAYQVLRPIPIVFLTAKESDDDVEAEIKAGAAAHITKPVDPQSLLDTIHNIIG